MFYNILRMKCSLLNCGSNEILSLLHILRSPVYDIRELAGVEDEVGSMVSSLEREKGVLVDDLRWQGQHLSLSRCDPLTKVPGLSLQGRVHRDALSAVCLLMGLPPLFTTFPHLPCIVLCIHCSSPPTML